MSDPEHLVKMGATVSSFIGGHAGSLVIRGQGGQTRSFQAATADDNREALRRVLVAALCWLDGQEQLVMPAVHGDVVMHPQRNGQQGMLGG